MLIHFHRLNPLRLFRYPMLVLLAAVLAACAPGKNTGDADHRAQQKVFQWKLVTAWPKNYPGLGTGPENFAREVEKMSAGRLKIQVYGAGELVPALEVFDAVSRGISEMGHSGSYYDKGKIPASPFFSSIPFGMNAQEVNAWLHFGGGLELFQELYTRHNVLPFAGGNTGVQMGGWFNREIVDLNSLKGLKMRIPGFGSDVMRELGVATINLPGSELYTAMQTGLIDATEWVGPYNDLAFGLHEVASYYYYPGWQEPGSVVYFGINLDAWQELPKDLQAIVKNAALAANAVMLYEYTAYNQSALTDIIESHGIKVRRFPDDVLAAAKRASQKLVAELAEKDLDTKRIYKSYKKFQLNVRKYHNISERTMFNIRE